MHRTRLAGALLGAVVMLGLVGAGGVAAGAPTTVLQGRLRITAHDRRDGTTKVVYTLETAAGVRTLRLPAVPPETTRTRRTVKKALQANVDRVVQVSARARADGTWAVLGVVPVQLPPPPIEPPPLTPQNKNIAFVIVHWQGLGWNNVLDEATVRSWALSDPASLAAYYRVATNNVVRITGTVMTVTLPGTADDAAQCVPYQQLVKRSDAQLGAQLAPYTNVMFLPQFVGTTSCDVIGLGSVGGRTTALSGSWTDTLQKFVHVAAHELGHNLGLHHAGVVSCAPVTDACLNDDVDNYGDPWDAMGNKLPVMQFSAVHKQMLNVLAPTAVALAAPGTNKYWVYASDAPGAGGMRLLEVPRGTSGQLFGLELRGAATQFGPSSLAPASYGVSIRLFDGDSPTLTSGDSTVLIDTVPATPTAFDAPLQQGRRYTDAISGVTISVDVVANPWALVTVTR